jgi:PHD/YefM family antitoxin component YafN of YafNO toxin-antitoxin module
MASTTILPQNIHSLTNFLRHHKRHLQQLKRSGRPNVLTLNGKAEVVVQDASAYQEMIEALEAAQTKVCVRPAASFPGQVKSIKLGG